MSVTDTINQAKTALYEAGEAYNDGTLEGVLRFFGAKTPLGAYLATGPLLFTSFQEAVNRAGALVDEVTVPSGWIVYREGKGYWYSIESDKDTALFLAAIDPSWPLVRLELGARRIRFDDLGVIAGTTAAVAAKDALVAALVSYGFTVETEG